jgi:mRNA interferase RelE/StbE
MRREIVWESTAAKEFDRLPPVVQEDILQSLAHLVIEERGDVKRLQGVSGAYRLRVGEYRVLFMIEGLSLIVIGVRTRGAAYRR